MKQLKKGKEKLAQVKNREEEQNKGDQNNPRYQAILGLQPSYTGVWARIALKKQMTVKETSHKRRKMFLTQEKQNIW